MAENVNPTGDEQAKAKAAVVAKAKEDWKAGTKPAYVAQLKGDLQNNEFFAGFADQSELAQFALESDGKLSKALFVPGDGAKEEDIAAFRKGIGVPDSADGYKIAKPAEWPENLPYDTNVEGWYKKEAHRLGLNQTQAESFFKGYTGMYMESIKAAIKGGLETLQKDPEWNTQEKMDANLVFVTRAVEAILSPESKTYLDLSGRGNHPALVKDFAKLGKMLTEGTFAESAKGGEKPKSGLSYPSMQK